MRELVEAGVPNTAIARKFDVGEATVRRFLAAAVGGDGLPPEIPVIVRDYSGQESHRVYPLGDVHLASTMHNAEMWAQWLGYLTDNPDRSLLGTGDFLNSALKDSKSESYDELLTVGASKRLLRKQLEPLAKAGRVDALMPGNHEDRIYRAVGDCPILDICDSLDIPYVPASALIVYKVGDQTYDFFVRHGTGNGQSLVTLAKGGAVIHADVYVTGHVHRRAVTVDDFFVRDGNRVDRVQRYFVSSGSFLSYERYAAQRGYSPGTIGAPRIFLDGRQKDIKVSL